jgi:isoquinoline 1-oxidoreductase alpha subunit
MATARIMHRDARGLNALHRPRDEPCGDNEYNRRMQQAPQTPPAEIVPEPIRKGIDVSVNGKRFRHTGDPDMPLLWYLRDVLRLTGCKYGCDDKSCGACSVLVDGKLKRACAMTMADVADSGITTVEGLAGADGTLHPVQQAWIDEDAILCGYCQAGQIMAAVDLLARKPKPSDSDIDGIGNLCRCGSYPRIRRAVLRASQAMQGKAK